jgi:hypothetical protein
VASLLDSCQLDIDIKYNYPLLNDILWGAQPIYDQVRVKAEMYSQIAHQIYQKVHYPNASDADREGVLYNKLLNYEHLFFGKKPRHQSWIITEILSSWNKGKFPPK